MKAWALDHPKAKLMERKRAAILAAARARFLQDGYSGASMEGIAAAAEVSIMTLYRHAASKDELFTGVIHAACEHTPEEMEAAAHAAKTQPMDKVLTRVGTLFQEKIFHPETIALLRTVMMETTRFPHLGQVVYREYVQAWQDNLFSFLHQRPDIAALLPERLRALLAQFIDDLIGADLLRTLLGEPAAGTNTYHARAVRAAAAFIESAKH